MNTSTDPIPAVPFERVAAFVRLITHDVRNGLNALELQSAYLSEIAEDKQVREELMKLREIVAGMTRSMQGLSSSFAEVRPSALPYPARELLSAFQEKMQADEGAEGKPIEWDLSLKEEEIDLDFNLLTLVLQELARNAVQFYQGEGPIRFSARCEDGAVRVEVSQPSGEPAGDPMRWGREPLVTTRRGGYGLGLFQVRRILDAMGGTWDARYIKVPGAAGETKVRLSFPVATGAEQRTQLA